MSGLKRLFTRLWQGSGYLGLLFATNFLHNSWVAAQVNTIGVIDIKSNVADGFTLFAPVSSTDTYLIDNCGRVINAWTNSTFTPGNSVYLTKDGSLIKTCSIPNQKINLGGLGGRLEKWSWKDSLLWEFTYSTDQYSQHHDIEVLPNGNILILALERKVGLDLFAVGRNPALVTENEVWSEFVVEIKPMDQDSGLVVWEWHAWDHLVQNYDSLAPNYDLPSNHPELIDINFTPERIQKDWLHANAIDYNPITDQILISVLNWSELWIIDHSTSTLEASGSKGGHRNKGGDLLYRWGNPIAYGMGDSSDQKLFSLHDANWISTPGPDQDKIILFNNGLGRMYSSVEILAPAQFSPGDYIIEDQETFGPIAPDWIYEGDSTNRFFSKNMSGAQYQSNGNILICQAVGGSIFEVSREGEKVWQYINPVTQNGTLNQGSTVNPSSNVLFRAERYSPTFDGFLGKDLIPGEPLELNYNILDCLETLSPTDSLSCDFDSTVITPFNSPVCLTGGDHLLSAIPDGGLFSGTGVQENHFDPIAAGEGIHIIYYAYNLHGCNILDSILIDVQICTNTEDFFNSAITIFPNPNRGNFTVGNLSPGAKFEIFNSYGESVTKVDEVKESNLSFHNFVPGIYYLTLRHTEYSYVKKFMIL